MQWEQYTADVLLNQARSTDMGEIKANNNAADAIPEVSLLCGEAKPDSLLKWSAEDMPDTIVKKKEQVCADEKGKQAREGHSKLYSE